MNAEYSNNRTKMTGGALTAALAAAVTLGAVAAPAGAQTSPSTPTGPNVRNGNTGGATDSPGPTYPGEVNRSGVDITPNRPNSSGTGPASADGTLLNPQPGYFNGPGAGANIGNAGATGGGAAQSNRSAGQRGRAGYAVRSAGAASSSLLPSNVQPAMSRMVQMMELARSRQRYAPAGAQQSYRNAENALRSALAAAKMVPSNAARNTVATNGATISLHASAQDVRALRSAADRASSARQANALRRLATLYATGAKEFYTGQLREALLEPEAERIVIRNDSRTFSGPASGANSGYGTASSAIQSGGAPANTRPGANTVGGTSAGLPLTTPLTPGPASPVQVTTPPVDNVVNTLPVVPVVPGGVVPVAPVVPGAVPVPVPATPAAGASTTTGATAGGATP